VIDSVFAVANSKQIVKINLTIRIIISSCCNRIQVSEFSHLNQRSFLVVRVRDCAEADAGVSNNPVCARFGAG